MAGQRSCHFSGIIFKSKLFAWNHKSFSLKFLVWLKYQSYQYTASDKSRKWVFSRFTQGKGRLLSSLAVILKTTVKGRYNLDLEIQNIKLITVVIDINFGDILHCRYVNGLVKTRHNVISDAMMEFTLLHNHNWPLSYGMGEYRHTSNISCTLVGNKFFYLSDVVGASPVGAAPITSSFST